MFSYERCHDPLKQQHFQESSLIFQYVRILSYKHHTDGYIMFQT